MRTYLVFDQDYLDIPLQDFPGKEDLIVCHDPQKRLGEITWAILECTGAEPETPAKALCLFWDKEKALEVARYLINKQNINNLFREK